IAAAAEEVVSGAHDEEFPIDVFQTGSGTSSNMNANEVIARLASARLADGHVHPNDHVNMSQSSNDVFPSAVHLAAALAITQGLAPAMEKLTKALRKKQREFAHEVKSGRTHLMDATTVTLGQEFGGYAAQIEAGIARMHDLQPRPPMTPGNVNPEIPEVVTQVSTQVIGNDAAIAFGGSQGNFELNVFVPIIARNLLESIHLLASARSVFADKCVRGIEANSATLERNAESSPVIATALVPHLGYETTAGIIKESNRTGKSSRQVVRSCKLMTRAAVHRALDAEAMT